MKNELLNTSLKLGAFAALFLTVGCAEYHHRVLDNMEAKGPEFTQVLSKEYEELGKTEENIMYDEASADYYFQKAIRAKEGCPVLPACPEKWDIHKDHMPELVTARARLINAMNFGARDIAPRMTAYAQAHYDCWVEQQSEDWQKEDIARCRSEFYTAMAIVEFELMGGHLNAMPSSMIMFGLNSSHLDDDGMRAIDAIAQEARDLKFQHHILLVGRTDKVGDLKHNKQLSQHRATAVKRQLIRRGVPPHLISIKAAGETPGPKVDAHNRRVDVIFLNYR
ncbi:MAG: OmpA family protein [Alphaproteobacteria bacterium]|nr:OmpA family protein [Alphaproteobacteria bacterium]